MGERITQDQAPFRIGVGHFDRLAAQRDEHIIDGIGIRTDHVFGDSEDRHQVDLRLSARSELERAQRIGGPAHVEFHPAHRGARFQCITAAVKGDAFADEGRIRRIACVRVGQRDQIGAFAGTLIDAQQGAGSHLSQGVSVEDFDR